jgi:hypothetical protein
MELKIKLIVIVCCGMIYDVISYVYPIYLEARIDLIMIVDVIV